MRHVALIAPAFVLLFSTAFARGAVTVESIDFGPGITSSTALYDADIFGDDLPPTTGIESPAAYLGCYVALDPLGPSAYHYAAQAPEIVTPEPGMSSLFSLSTLDGYIATPGGVVGGTFELPESVLSRVFFARLTHGPGGTLSGPALHVLMPSEGFSPLTFELDGPSVQGPNTGSWYRVRAYSQLTSVGETSDLYVEEVIPSPGVAPAIALTALVALRRRRSFN